MSSQSDAESYKAEGNEAYKQQNYTEAVALYSKAIAANPDSAVYYGNRAAAYLMLDKYADALKDCESALSRDPKFVRVNIISRLQKLRIISF